MNIYKEIKMIILIILIVMIIMIIMIIIASGVRINDNSSKARTISVAHMPFPLPRHVSLVIVCFKYYCFTVRFTTAIKTFYIYFCFYSQLSQPTGDVSEEISTPSKSNFLFGSPSVASLSFQSVAASSLGGSPFGQKSQQKSPGFTGAGAQLFAAQNTEDDDGTAEVDHDGPHFEPIIPLPDMIDVKTGEEDEEVVFSHRAKLYRFVADDKQWKERGIGDIKLLRNRQSGKMRVLMRRDQVLKICANHQITVDMKLQPNAGSDRSWVWNTLADFSEQECKAEQLAVRFKSEDIAKHFKEKFEECQELMKNQTPAKSLQEDQGHQEVKDDLFTKFKATEGSWECDICMVRNDCDKVECAACGSLKPGAEPRQDHKNDMRTSFPFVGSTPSSGSAFSFGSSTVSTGAEFSFNQTRSSGSVFSFGSSTLPSGAGFFFNQTPSFGERVSFGSVETRQSHEKPINSFGSTSQIPNSSSGVPFSLCSYGQGKNGSEHTEENKKVLLNQTPSFVAGFSFSSPKTSQIDEKPILAFSLLSEKPNLSSGVPFSFGSFGQGGNVSEQRMENKKVSYRSGTPSTDAVPFSSATPLSFGSTTSPAVARFSFGSTTSSAGTEVSFGSTISSTGAGLSFSSAPSSAGARLLFGSTTTSAGTELSFGSAPLSAGVGFNSFGSNTTSSAGAGLSFGSSKSSAGAGLSFGSTTSSAGAGLPFVSTTSPPAVGLSFGSTTSPHAVGISFGLTTSPPGAGLSFGLTSSSSRAEFSFSSTTSSAEAGLSFGSTTSSAGTGFSFGSTPSAAGAALSFVSTTSPPATGLSFGSTTLSARAGFSSSSTTSSAGAGLSFGSTTSPSAAGLSFGSTSPPAAGLSFGSTTSPPVAGLSFGSTSSATAGFWSSSTSSAGAGVLFGSTTPSTEPAFSFGSTTPSTRSVFSFGLATPSTSSACSFGSTTTST